MLFIGETRLLTRLEPDGAVIIWVLGVAQINRVIFILYRDFLSALIEMFDGRTFEKLEGKLGGTIILADVMSPSDMVGDSDTSQLLFSQYNTGDICRVDVRSAYGNCDRYKFIDHKLGVNGMSLISRRLLVTSDVSLTAYNADDGGELLVVRLPKSAVKSTTHAVETSRNTFIVSYKSIKDGIELMEVDARGQVVREFGCTRGQFHRPGHVALDSTGRVLFIDWDGDRVVVLNEEGQVAKVLLRYQRDSDRSLLRFDFRLLVGFLNGKQLNSPPWRLNYHAGRKLLCVGLWDGRMSIYEWK